MNKQIEWSTIVEVAYIQVSARLLDIISNDFNHWASGEDNVCICTDVFLEQAKEQNTIEFDELIEDIKDVIQDKQINDLIFNT